MLIIYHLALFCHHLSDELSSFFHEIRRNSSWTRKENLQNLLQLWEVLWSVYWHSSTCSNAISQRTSSLSSSSLLLHFLILCIYIFDNEQQQIVLLYVYKQMMCINFFHSFTYNKKYQRIVWLNFKFYIVYWSFAEGKCDVDECLHLKVVSLLYISEFSQ